MFEDHDDDDYFLCVSLFSHFGQTLLSLETLKKNTQGTATGETEMYIKWTININKTNLLGNPIITELFRYMDTEKNFKKAK